MKKLILLLFLIGPVSLFAANKVGTYQNFIKNDCQETKVSLLLVKKSLIELVRGMECEGKFTSIIINKCEKIDCRKIAEIFRQVQQSRSGSVVGDD